MTWEKEVIAISLLAKLLVIPAYHSTDFEVHRNWLAITKSLPVKKWYYEDTSEWTLDYPPFFAWFEWTMAQAAHYTDPSITTIRNLNYDNWTCILFQRASVIITEVVLPFALSRYVQKSVQKSQTVTIAASIFLNPGFLIIDHIHFQYNGFLFGILLWSIILAKEGKTLLSGVLFAILLNFKHIYLYLAPAWFVYLLRIHCMPQGRFSFQQLITLGAAVAAVFAVAVLPFASITDLQQLLSRLFPFTRGLNHAYWAPNFWAMYSFVDRLLLQVAGKLHLPVKVDAIDSITRGLVGDTAFAVLPDVAPRTTFVITLVCQLAALFKLWSDPTWKRFVGSITLCAYASFLFGWHVHEKAILLVSIPFSFLAADSADHLRVFTVLSSAGLYSLFPLLFDAQEAPLKITYTLLWLVICTAILKNLIPTQPLSPAQNLFAFLESAYIVGFIPLHVVASGLSITIDRMAFLPLMITSVYCSTGVIYTWLKFQALYFTR